MARSLSGIWTALATPFKEDESICYESFYRLLEHQLKSPIRGLVTTGTTGESATLTDDEILELTTYTLRKAKDHFPIFAGIGSYNTHKTIEIALKLQALGVDGFSIILPYYNKPTQEGLFQHFSAIAKAVKLPILIYCNPGRCGIQIDLKTVSRLRAAYPSIIGIKDCGASVDRLNHLIHDNDTDFTVLTGDDNWLLAACALGAKGAISVVSNIIPHEWSEIVNLIIKNDLNTAKSLYAPTLPLIRALFLETSPIPLKYILYKMGIFKTPITRLPLTPLSHEHRSPIDRILQTLKIIA
jgi:4-hydroxy-tetrahydrodipicolinate synthase